MADSDDRQLNDQLAAIDNENVMMPLRVEHRQLIAPQRDFLSGAVDGEKG